MEEVIFVRGGMRENQGTGGIDRQHLIPLDDVWRFFHPRDLRNNTLLTLFDYTEAKIKKWKNWDGKGEPKSAPTSENPIPNNSIIDLYEYIKKLGDTSPGSLVELQIFSHGDSVGPVIINTFEGAAFINDDTRRDPNDKEPRKKDFSIPTVLGGKEGIRFKKAFSAKAHIKLWGCDHEQEHRDRVHDFLRSKSVTEKKRIQTAYVIHIRDSSYQFALHKVTNIAVFASPLGWGTDPSLPFGIQGREALEKIKTSKYKGVFPPRKGDVWWRVSPYFRPMGFEFYKTILGAEIDTLDYVAYKQSIIRIP